MIKHVLATLVAGGFLPGGWAVALEPQGRAAQHMVDVWQEGSGLPQRFVLSILQTRDGYIWLGTKGGLARFDGVRFTVYDDRQPGQLHESEVWALAEGDDSGLWIGTFGGGLARLKDGTFTTYTARDGLPSDLVTSLSPGPDGSLWIGTDRGLVRMHAGRLTAFGAEDGLPDNRILRLHTDQTGVLWIGTERGLASYSDGRFVRHPIELPGEPHGSVAAIAGDARHGLWIGLWVANRGVGLRRLKDGVLTRFTSRDGLPCDEVKSIVVDAAGTVWIGTLAGICRYRNGRFGEPFSELVSHSAQRASAILHLRGIQSLFVDRERNVWIGTRSEGLVRLRDGTFFNVTGSGRDDADLEVRSVFEDSRGAVWLGTANEVRRIKDGATRTHRLPGARGADTLAEDGAGILWIGTSSGLFNVRGGRLRRASVPVLDDAAIFVLFRDTKDDLWVGTGADGLYRRSAGRWTHYGPRQGLLGDQVRAVAEDSEGGLWVATRNGGVSCLRGGRFATYGIQQGLASPAAQALFVDRDDAVWVATRRGLNRIRAGQVATITARNGLPANYFYQIIADDRGSLWLTYGRGIARVPKQELDAVADGRAKVVQPVLFGTESGILSTAMSVGRQPLAWKCRDGRLWFATGSGAAVVDPGSMNRNAVPPPVHIEELRVDQRLHRLSPVVECPPGNGNVEIRYTGLSYVAPGQLRFKYLLEGFDQDWRDAEARRVAYYTNLPPAAYRFRVLAYNNDGVPSDQEAVLSFRLQPHWYQSRLWFAFVALGALGLAAGVARHLVTRRFRREVQELERRQAIERDRARIAKDIHDDLGAGLTRISLLSELAQREPAPESMAHLRRISETARELARTMDEIVWAINARNDTLDGLTSYVCRFAQGHLTIAGIRCRLDVPTELPSVALAAEVRHNLFLAVKESLNNVVKHAQASEVHLELRLDGNLLTIVIEDDGRGLAAVPPPTTGQGLGNVAQRLQALGGRCVIDSTPGRGTRVTLTAAIPPQP